MHDKLRIVRKHEKNKRDGKSDLPELKIKASRSAHASPLYPHRLKAAMGIKGGGKTDIRVPFPDTDLSNAKHRRKTAPHCGVGERKSGYAAPTRLCRCHPQNPPGYPHPCRFQRKKQARGYGGFAPIYDAQHLLIHFSTDLSTLRTDYAHCKTAIPPQPSAPQGCKRTAAEISVQLVRGVPTPFRRFAAWNRFGHQGTFSRKRPRASAGGPCCA